MCGPRHHRASPASAETTRPADDRRASDAERDAVVSDLRAHAAEGRIGVDELDERVAAALVARTRADLAPLLGDLPAVRRPAAESREFREHLRSYLMVMALLVAIWALAGAGYFWPVWPILGWGIGVASHASSLRARPRRRAFG